MSDPPSPRAWWKSAIVYQIYPISFFDSNGDGIGDLNGIHEKLDYLKDLGVDVLWLSPIYSSPLADMGYDISDYRNIDPRYGTLEDYDRLLKGVHQRGMKLIFVDVTRMDLVANHTSDEHDWFVQSRSSKDDPKRDWYIWRPPKYDVDGERLPPNNWKSVFQGSAWEYDDKTGEYYLHLYVTKQPDLNWDNQTVRDAVWDVMRFWINRGCDGFRMDVINIISKTEGLPDAPEVDPTQYYQPASMYFANGPRVHEYIKEMNQEVLSKHDLITVGETPFTHEASELAAYVLPKNKELNMVFHFELMDLDSPDYSPLAHKAWKLTELKAIVRRWQQYKREEGFWNAVFIENHDHSRSVSRFGNDSSTWRSISAKMLSIMEITQTGTLYVYQGQELGLKNFPRSWGIEEYKDVASQNYWNLILEQRKKASGGKEVDMSDMLDDFQRKARDHARMPMQWDDTKHAGFTTGTPWMRVNDDFVECNASAQAGDKDSVLSFWKRAIGTRKQHDVLIYGDFELLLAENEQVFAYKRTLGPSSALVLLNFQEAEATVSLAEVGELTGYKFVLGNYGEEERGGLRETASLRGYEGRLYVK
ncbi:glycoside hydrolase family 13 protein [Serpula lacrymans var. lacrymans S7.3]|uniref:Glycoside hydrolase family 13 protein n=2 Tax=Serpula lacrymans var. lacrymans TaxID=341189 RepID=F8QFH0_SERL3|nr:glycoside hydrolase family 13 protein [Serpula lacrymans var. lacrymans S7.9]EGN92954.1 glycoside hydrolase family 13 protein [Serpula lacrymans var. lacrymans S7.3]EGO19670.1 glycoside hydrolase family 13 protein [Serpula lacrymans var. lacrymans S7.9]